MTVAPAESLIAREDNLSLYFRAAVQKATAKLEVTLQANSEFYLVQLLGDFCFSEKFFSKSDDTFESEPLALMLKRALDSDSLAGRISSFKRLGDRALFLAGCFPEHARRRMVDRNYFIDMGSGAYQSLATMFNTRNAFTEIYGELGHKFAGCAELLAEVKRASRGNRNEDLLHFYERWLATGSRDLEQILQRAGIPTNSRTPSIS